MAGADSYSRGMKTDSVSPAAISAFWGWFTKNRASLDVLNDTDEPLWDAALAELQKLHPDLSFAMSEPDGSARDFVVTAECDTELFPLVDRIVGSAPTLEGWQFLALKPAMGFNFVSEFEDLELDPREMWFFPMRNSARPRALGLRVAVAEFTKRRQDQLTDAVAMIIEEGLGERAAAMNVEHLEVVAMPGNLKAEGFAPLPELGAYIAWNKANRSPSQGWSGVAEWKGSGKRRGASEEYGEG